MAGAAQKAQGTGGRGAAQEEQSKGSSTQGRGEVAVYVDDANKSFVEGSWGATGWSGA